MQEITQLPEWFDGKKINEILFCQEFLEEHPMVCVKGTFFTVEKRITDERELKKLIYDKLKGAVSSGVAKKLDSILEVLRAEDVEKARREREDERRKFQGNVDLPVE